MFPVINKQILAKNIKRIDIAAEHIARRVQPGQFVLIRPVEGGEGIPLSVIDQDPDKGTISVIIREVGETSQALTGLALKQNIHAILGPLGTPAQIKKRGVVVCVATGIGVAQILPICRGLKDAGNKVVGIIGARTKRELLLEAQMRLACDRMMIATEDGTYERRGLATELLERLLDEQGIDQVNAIGSADLMRTVCAITKPRKVKTLVQLRPMMVDCLGLCGACRLRVGNKTVLACVDGPEFDGHRVDFDDYEIRMNAFKEQVWDNRKATSNPSGSDPKTLTKFLSGILKN
ncbi:MAG: sulfide/dihydroorotate dehydrogenase-like FAD/NAD-binding protein [Candidatus Omnitrophica bacterium]|nr:sulfide/dihydroorotate dehydrogenase-like FAD/NAD-binding protein [Candidatus Omnitrophota bacterium]MCB9720779.1 sulfide/dihydroorotate dehydrogenase-like FAD/NAD-binding protein [Candidatus Omnitrophota bacterium]